MKRPGRVVAEIRDLVITRKPHRRVFNRLKRLLAKLLLTFLQLDHLHHELVVDRISAPVKVQ